MAITTILTLYSGRWVFSQKICKMLKTSRPDYEKNERGDKSFLFHKLTVHIIQTVYKELKRSYGVYISQLVRFARASSYVTDFNTRNKLLTQKLLKQGYRYHKLRKTFSKFYRRYFDLISKFQVGLKSLLRQGLSEPDFYGDLVYKLKKIVGSSNFSAQFIKIISHYKKIGYNINVLQQTACLVVNPITVGNFAFLFNCTPVGRTSDSMMVPT